MYGALFLALAIRYQDFSLGPGPFTKIFLIQFTFIHLFWLLFLFILDFYEIPLFRKKYDFLRNLIIFLILAGIIGTIYFYLRPIIVPKTTLVLDILIFSLLLFGWRYLFSRLLKFQNLKEKIIFIGFRPEFKEIISDYLSQSGYEITAFFNPDFSFTNELNPFSLSAKQGVISDVHQLRVVIEREKVDSIIFALDFHKNDELAQQLFSNLSLKLNYINFASFYESLTKKVPIETINEIWFLENFSQVEKKVNQILKRSFDILLSSLGLLITLILFPFIALTIKIDSPGPIFYNQRRVGKGKKVFVVHKFRTMIENPNQDRKLWREKDASQITKVGKFLRKTHLDELPQLWNILKGDLSFVGPRPEWIELAKIFEKEIPFYSQRYLVRSGFTGWAQLSFPSSASIAEAKEKFQYDLYYIKNRSFLFDLGIILKTIKIIFKK